MIASSEWLQKQVATDFGLLLNSRQLQQFEQYYHLLIETNRQLNLTAITEEREVYIKHFYDSLSIATILPLNRPFRVVDVGTGAGFPGIPLKIAFPQLKVVLADSLQKRIRFLNSVITSLELTEIEAIHGRAEDLAQVKEYREQFDLAVARAVAPLAILSEYCLPFVRPQGFFISQKGPNLGPEIEAASYALHVLGKAKLTVHQHELPEEMGNRHLLLLEKRDHSPKKYPRKAGMPQKDPLQGSK